MGSECGCRLVFEKPLPLAAVPPLLLDEAVWVVDAFSLPFALFLLDPGTDVEADADWGGDGGRAYSSVQRLAVRSCCARLRMYSVAIEGTSHRMHDHQRLYGGCGVTESYLTGRL